MSPAYGIAPRRFKDEIERFRPGSFEWHLPILMKFLRDQFEGGRAYVEPFARSRTLTFDPLFSAFQQSKHPVKVFAGWPPTVEDCWPPIQFVLTRSSRAFGS